ncbi:gdsl-like lipase acylhydrolase [Ophiostoma piceae UAMH 11346]|uniref:Gdsl-like lipase acylhydrolase n=1 Tax=Ophiostoma piceae (strain UAMH 11346) TaxID=1262450 RepID=S3D6W0_OPHP1|nr:gdsl-like lipase acylhydrolase [Ophiostoma piceae UAMH 11346]
MLAHLASVGGQRATSRSRLRTLMIASVAVFVIIFVWTTSSTDGEPFKSVVSSWPEVVSSTFGSDAAPDTPSSGTTPNPDVPPPPAADPVPVPSADAAPPKLNLPPVEHPAAPPAAVFGEPPAVQKSTPLFILVGDSTTNGQLRDGGGWGDAFLWLLMRDAEGVNRGANGAVSTHYYNSSMWTDTIDKVKAAVPFRKVYVTIQFGHNDQNPATNVTIDMYQDALATMAREVVAAGGTPMLVSPLARRDFKSLTPGAPPTIVDNLGNEREATKRAYEIVLAEQAVDAPNHVRFVNLNAASLAYIAAIGLKASYRYNKYHPFLVDTTHLNEHGALVFSRIVADLMLGHPAELVPPGQTDPWTPGNNNPDDGLSNWIQPNPYLTGLIWHGDPA